MALYSQATDLNTRERIWVGTNVVKGRSQANSHTRSWDHDGLTTADLAGLHTDYTGPLYS